MCVTVRCVCVTPRQVPFVTKVQHAQDAGAVAVIIADDGRCSEDFVCDRFLGNRGDKPYFAAVDNEVCV